MVTRKCFGIIFFLFLLGNHIAVIADVFTVSNAQDSGPGSFRWALENAENSSGTDSVTFNIPKTDPNFLDGVWKIVPSASLPKLTRGGTIIDGSTQTINQGDTNPLGPEIFIDGSTLSGSESCIEIWSAENQVVGLAIGKFPRNGIFIKTANGHHNYVKACYVGTDPTGSSSQANRTNGINITTGAHHNRIGGLSLSERNIISGNLRHGINIEVSHHNLIVNNFIGVDRTGMQPLPNGVGETKRLWNGVMINANSYANQIGGDTPEQRNIISGNNRTGVRLYNIGCDSNVVIGNYLGVGADGDKPIPNGECGVVLGDGARANQIGGMREGEGNVISGNHSSGLQIRGNDTASNKVQGNIIGGNAHLTTVVGNAHNGIYVYGDTENGPNHNLIGPDNIIIGNGWQTIDEWAAIRIDHSNTAYNQITENYIGTTPDAQLTSGTNNGFGIAIQYGAHNNTVGPNNVITHQPRDGVLISGNSTDRNRLTRNAIYQNHQNTIHLIGGANDAIPTPEITLASWSMVEGHAVQGSTIEVYSAEAPGEAKLFEGTTTTDGSGRFHWEGTPHSVYLTVLATDEIGNSSELSSAAVLPVELSSFTADFQDNSVVLSWTTASETNNLGFEVQKSVGDKEFVALGFVSGFGTSIIPHFYSYVDTDAGFGLNRYRLSQIDLDGSVTISDNIEVNIAHPQQYNLLQNHPNPFNPSTIIEYEAPKDGQVALIIFDVRGQTIKSLVESRQQAGHYQIRWDGTDETGAPVAAGLYLCRLQAEDYEKTIKLALVR